MDLCFFSAFEILTRFPAKASGSIPAGQPDRETPDAQPLTEKPQAFPAKEILTIFVVPKQMSCLV